MKENNGHAARRRLQRQLCIIIAIFALLIVVLTILGVGKDGRVPVTRENLDHIRRQSAEFIRNRKHGGPLANQQQHHRLDPRGGGGAGAAGAEEFDEIVDEAEIMERILTARYNLIDLHIVESEVRSAPSHTYAGVYGTFCELDFAQHKRDPSSVPMFRDLVNSSPHCQRHPYKMELKKVVALARRRDAQVAAQEDLVVPKVLNLTGVVFHESRCGSTLVANTLIGMNPTQHRTYSESTPPAVALKGVCGETYQLCTLDQASWVLRDVMYLMSRSNDPLEERVFFKFQSVTARNLPVFLKAFPDVPWMFVYRDPVQVMMSHFRDGIDRANCVRGRQRPPRIVQELVQRRGTDLEGRKLNVQTMPGEYYCAAHLASITESALSALQDDPDEVAKHRGIPVRYDDLPDILYEEILPNHWGVTVSPEEVENILKVSGKYAKGRGNRAGEFQGDSEQKEEEASTLVKEAAELFLQPSFDALSQFEY